MKRIAVVIVGAAVALSAIGADYPIQPVPMNDVRVTKGFWFDRIETNRLCTLKTCFKKCNDTPRIANFTNAANRTWGTFGGIYFDDSDVYKVMEGAAYIYAANPDPELMKYMTWLIGQMAKAQELDGYLYTARTLGCKDVRKFGRWETLEWGHELYNQGHMIEAAVAWHQVTGHDDFLKIAKKSADLMCRVFGYEPTQLKYTSGHQEIELALCKLYRDTGDAKYLKLAKFFLDIRGDKRMSSNCYTDKNCATQKHQPLLEQTEAVGHAVRAGYMYSGMADVAALTGEKAYVKAIDTIWHNVVDKKLHLNGGIGARHGWKHPKWGPAWEAFGGEYDLPNDRTESYLETCAAIANALWNQRMFMTKGDAKYVDVMERTLYNGFLSGISLTGDHFFYPNPQACTGGYSRVEWFGCSCCPVNDVRFVPQVPSFSWATDGNDIYWNLFMSGTAKVKGVNMQVDTDYPWSGSIKLTVNPAKDETFKLKVRIPGWARGKPVPSDLYRQTKPSSVMELCVAVNGAAVNGVSDDSGYLSIGRTWKLGDVVTIELPMEVKRIAAHPLVKADQGRLAVERGPIVYCAEGVDNDGKAYSATLPADATFKVEEFKIGDKTYPGLRASNGLKLIPYCLWDNRQPGNDMQVWFKAQ